jgi:hypothetical protein
MTVSDTKLLFSTKYSSEVSSHSAIYPAVQSSTPEDFSLKLLSCSSNFSTRHEFLMPVESVGWVPTFQMNKIPPPSGLK